MLRLRNLGFVVKLQQLMPNYGETDDYKVISVVEDEEEFFITLPNIFEEGLDQYQTILLKTQEQEKNL